MNKFQPYLGYYYFMGLTLQIKQNADQLLATMPGVPTGFEIVMTPLLNDNFQLQGGPLDGSTSTFSRNAAGEVISLAVGEFELTKIDSLDDSLPQIKYLLAPELKLTPAKESRFAALLQTCLTQPSGAEINYDLPYPKYEFVQYVTAQDKVIFHGSNNSQITTFEPLRKSVELRDKSGRGNIQAVYGTHEGLWSMFFAVVDRARLKGSIRNGVQYFHNRSGESISLYNFSINQEQLAEKPYTPGALYFLPRDSFKRLQLTPDSYANEWASEQTVHPYAKLLLQPTDFPFLEQIGGHDDSELMRMNTIAENIRATASAASLRGDRFEVTLPAGAAVLADLDTYLRLQKIMMPAARFTVIEHTNSVVMIGTSLPAAVQQVIREQYRDLLAKA